MPEKTPFDIDERMSIIGTEGIIHVQDTFPNLGIVRQRQAAQPRHDLLAEFEGVRGGALARGIRLFRRLRAEGRNAGDRAARKMRRPRWRRRLPPKNSARTGKVVRLKISDRIREYCK